MRAIILLLAMMPGDSMDVPSIMVPEPCELAVIDGNAKDHLDKVVVDWDCADKLDREFLADPTGQDSVLRPMAHIMKAIRDGKAESK
jgi:hypothetical protein